MAVEAAEVEERPVADGRGLRWHALILAILLVAVWPFLTLGGAVFTTDEGSYALQARVLNEGTWDMGYAFIEEDPEGRFLPYLHSRIVDDEVIVDARHPTWPVLLAGSVGVFGEEVGLRILGVVSVAAFAAVAWAIGHRLGGPEAARWAFWIGAASPVLANAWLLWAHAPSAVAAALLVLSGIACRDRPAWIAVAAAAGIGTVLLRPEGLLWAIAVGAALVVIGANQRQRACGLVIGASAAAAWLVESRWVEALLARQSEIAPRRPGAEPAERGVGLVLALVGQDAGSTLRPLLGGLALALAVAAAVVIRSRRSSISAGALLAGSAVALGLRWLLGPADAPTGLFIAAPALVVALALPRLDRAAWFLPVASALFLGAIGLSIQPNGGGLQWGGRYLTPMLAVVVVTAALAAAAMAQSPRGRNARLGLAALLVVQAIGMVVGPDAERVGNDRDYASVAALGPTVTLTEGTTIARFDWDAWPDRCWLALPRDPDLDDVREALDVLARTGVTELSYVRVDPVLLEAAGAHVEAVDGAFGIITLDPQPVRSAISPPYKCGSGSA